MKRYKCNVGNGCDKSAKDRCEMTSSGKPTIDSNGLYICPYNHWRGCRWVEIKDDNQESEAAG